MQKITKKIILSFFSLLLIVTVLGTSTYAWFTIGQTVMIEEFEMDVESGKGLEFAYVPLAKIGSKDNKGLEFVSILNGQIIKDLIVEDYQWEEDGKDRDELFKMKDFTSTNGKDIFKMNKDDKSLPLLDATASDGGYLEFTLRFRTLEEDLAHLVWSEVELTSDGVNKWVPGFNFDAPEFVEGEGERKILANIYDEDYIQYTYKAADAARIAIEGYVLDNEIDNNYLNSVVVYENETRDFEDNEDKTSVYGNSVLSNEELNWEEGNLYYFDKSYAVDIKSNHKEYRAAKTIQSLTKYYDQVDEELKDVQIVVGTFKTLYEDSEVEDPYKYTDVTIRIYIEGFDAEAFDIILGDTLKTTMKFSLVTDEELKDVYNNLTDYSLVNIIEGYYFDVKNEEGLEVAYLYEDFQGKFVERLTNSRLLGYFNDDYQYDEGNFNDNFKMGDVTSVDGDKFQYLSYDDAGTGSYELKNADRKDKGFIEFTLLFRTLTQEDNDINLIWKGAQLESKGVDDWVPDFPFNAPDEVEDDGTLIDPDPEEEEYIQYKYYIFHAARISVTGIVEEESKTAVYELAEKDLGTGDSPDYLNTVLSNTEPDWTHGSLQYFKKSTDYNLEKDFETGYGENGAQPYKAAETFTEFEEGVIVAKFIESDDENDKYSYAEVKIRIYIETFDAEAFDAVLEDLLTAKLEFGYQVAESGSEG